MPVYLSLVVTMFFLPRGSMRGRASSSPRICGQLLHRQIDFEDVPARLIAGAAVAVALRRGRAAGRLALALADAAGALLAVAELRDVDLRQGDADEVLALLADHLAAADVLATGCSSPCRARACGSAGDRVRFSVPRRSPPDCHHAMYRRTRTEVSKSVAWPHLAAPSADSALVSAPCFAALLTSSSARGRRCWPRSSARPSALDSL